MRFLAKNELSAYLNKNKCVEYFLGFSKENNLETLHWVSIERDGEEFIAYYHYVYDESDKGVASAYDYPYVEPDDIDGLELEIFDTLSEAIKFLEDEYECTEDEFFLEGQLDNALNEFSKE